MSNIIDGIPYGMGYEPTKVWEYGLHAFSPYSKKWKSSECLHQEDLDRAMKDGWVHRRPLPIISQHPGAIPLEPGEELKVGERYLTRVGTEVGPLRLSEASPFPFSAEQAPATWTKFGSVWNVKATQTDIIARLPKVEQKEPETENNGTRLLKKFLAEVETMTDEDLGRFFQPYLCDNTGFVTICGAEPEKAKEEKVVEPLREAAAPGLTEKCQKLCSAWYEFDGSPKTTAAVGMCIGEIFQSIKAFEEATQGQRLREKVAQPNQGATP